MFQLKRELKFKWKIEIILKWIKSISICSVEETKIYNIFTFSILREIGDLKKTVKSDVSRPCFSSI